VSEPARHPAERADSHDLIRGRVTLGEFEITVLSDGFFLLDGGAMFGVVPKTLWEARMPADAENRILLGLNALLVRDGKQTIVIETGAGNKFDGKMREIYGTKELLPAAFKAAGVDLKEVDAVINTHLHFDHCGWNTTRGADGAITPTFPNARYYAHRGEVAHGRLQMERDRMSYMAANYEPLIANGQMTFIDGPAKIAPGISVDVYPGHTAQMLAVLIDSGGRRGCYISDLIPTSAHLDLIWGMSYDLDPMTVIEQRKRFYAQAIAEQWLVFFTHDHHAPFGYLDRNERGKIVLRRQEAH
jgi:glyoxylase-like metal-dependent hydrolase (beta-lactamase superfamily II)